jgi:allophanate hydrolase
MSGEISITDIARLQEGYSAARYTPLDVIEEVNRRIEAAGDDHVWILRLSKKEMARRAAELGGRKAAAAKLPLYGVPFAVKDNMDVEGLPTTAGCPDFSYVAKQTAAVVQRLLDAGGILVGKTNLDQFATGLTGARSPYGVPRNPYNKDYIPGGSSSGSAVAVASGLVSFALGTDTAGSIRVPAGFNNVVGLKPTRGLLSISGIVPACRSLDCVGILAMDTNCAEAAMDVAIAPDATDAFSRNSPLKTETPAVHKIGILRSADRQFYGDDGAAAIYQSGVERLQRLGFACKEFDFGPFREAAEMLYNGPWMAERDVAVGDFIRRKPNSVVEVTRNAIMSASRFSAADTFKAYYRIKELRVATRTTWSEVDAIFVPTTPTIYRVDEVLKDPAATNGRLSHYTNFLNLLDLCAVAVPSGLAPNRLPVGVTLIAPAFHDRGVIAAGRTYMAAKENRGRVAVG